MCQAMGELKDIWNIVIFMILDLVAPIWHESEYGIILNGRRYTHVVWADNVWLLAACPVQLLSMINSFTELLHDNVLEWKLDSLMYIDSQMQVDISLTTRLASSPVGVPQVEGHGWAWNLVEFQGCDISSHRIQTEPCFCSFLEPKNIIC